MSSRPMFKEDPDPVKSIWKGFKVFLWNLTVVVLVAVAAYVENPESWKPVTETVPFGAGILVTVLPAVGVALRDYIKRLPRTWD